MAATMRSLRIGERDFNWGARTYVMGIVNVTPDSFSGDGVTDLEAAVAQARQMEEDGADLIDIGGESPPPETRSGPRLSAPDELAPVIPPGARGGAPARLSTLDRALPEILHRQDARPAGRGPAGRHRRGDYVEHRRRC